MIDHDILINNATPILNYLGINQENGYVFKSDSITGPAPCHGGDNPNGFSYKYDIGLWSCWTHGCNSSYGSNLIGLIKAIKKINFFKAKDIVENIILKNIDLTKCISKNREKREVNYWQKHINQTPKINPFELQSPKEYCEFRGFDTDLAIKYNMGICRNNTIMKNRFVIPIRNINGHDIAFTGRAIDDEIKPKWLHYPNGFTKSNNLFNIDNVVKYNNNGFIILVEGPFDVLKLEMAGIHNSVAIMGNNMCIGQIDIIKKCDFTDVIVALDNDSAGREGAIKTCRKLERCLMRLWTLDATPQKDWGDSSIEEIQNSIKSIKQI